MKLLDGGALRSGGAYAEALCFYHPSQTGKGAALRLEPRFSHSGAGRYNCFFLEMAVQQTCAQHQDGKRVPATFNWQEKLAVKLGFEDLCQILVVLEGRGEKLGGSREGLFHQNGEFNTIITCQADERGGCVIGLSRKTMGDSEARRVRMLLSASETLGLRHILQSSLFFLAFHQHLFGFWSGFTREGLPQQAC